MKFWQKQNKQILVLFITIVSVCFSIVIYRAYQIGITHDEAFSFFLIDSNYLNALATTANTHILNSLSMKTFNILNLNHWFFLRTHSVLSFLIFAYFNYRILDFFKTNLSKITFLFLMLCNPLTLEFFSLARGYGIALSFLMGTIYYSLSYIQHKSSSKKLQKIFIFGSLAMLGNYTVLFPIAGIFIYLFFIQKKEFINQIFSKKNLPYTLIFVIINIGAVANMLVIKHITNDLQYGADHSFILESLPSLFLHIAFIHYPSSSIMVKTGTIALSFFTFFLVINTFIISRLKKDNLLGFASSVFILSFIFYSLSHILFSSPYPLSRTTLSLFPFMAINLIFWLDRVIKSKYLKKAIKISCIFFLLYFSFQNFSLNHTLEWKNQSQVQYVFEDIIKLQKQKTDTPPSILCDESYYAVWVNYYSKKLGNKLKIKVFYIDRKIYDYDCFIPELKKIDFFIVTKQHNRNYYDHCPQLKLINEYKLSETKLFEVIE